MSDVSADVQAATSPRARYLRAYRKMKYNGLGFKFHKIMQTLEKSMKFSHQIWIPYRSSLQYGCSNMHFILAVYLNLQIYDSMMQAILVQT